MRPYLILLPILVLGGCVETQTAALYGPIDSQYAERPASFCENYAQQTYGSSADDLIDPEDGFGARQFALSQAQDNADRAYQRCLAGRTN